LLCGLVCGTSAIIGEYWLRIRQLTLKHEMLQRGLSADEISAVLDAGSKHSKRDLCAQRQTPEH
jgi:hypothetical protein